MNQLFIILAMIGATMQIEPHILEINPDVLSAELTTDYGTNTNDNLYQINLSDSSVLEGKNLFIIVESENADFTLSILEGDKTHKKRDSVLIDVNTFTGNIGLVMSDTYFNSQLDFFKESGKLRFIVSNKPATGNLSYTIKVQVGERATLQLGRSYTSRIDYMISDFAVDFVYDGTKQPDLKRLRFQLTSIKQKIDYSLSASLSHQNQTFLLNTVFKKSVGGIISEPKLPVCKADSCLYALNVHIEKVKTLNIESYLIGDIEKLSINHYEDYYDRVYESNVVTKYEVVYEPEMAGMDVSVSLIPVTGTSGLYINPITVPTDLNKYTWKELGPLAKRITIRWEELSLMKAAGSNLIVAVHSDKPGEYLLKIDAHEPGYKGRLTSGIIEAGFVKDGEISNYLYHFEVFETQEISFDVKMVVFSGDANLYLKHCEDFNDCKITDENINDGSVMAVENNHSTKTLKYNFTCEKKRKAQPSICQFIIGVKGNEDHGTHYDISLQESKFHRLMMPGHPMNLNLNPEEIVYLKFSYPKSQSGTKLYLSIEPIWGNFAISMSKKEEYPAINGGAFNEEFHTAKAGLYNATRTIPITTKIIEDYTMQGLYYIGVTALTSCSLNLKFFEKNESELTLHTLAAGNQSRGEVTSASEVVYYSIRLSLSNEQASTASINITPIKGSYTMFANRNGKFPTLDDHELISDSHHLELNYKDYDPTKDEYIIGVQLNSKTTDKNQKNQFLISFTYSNKPLMLNPGVISTHIIREYNYFLLEITKEMSDLLVIKTIVDGYNIDLCGKFASSERIEHTDNCDYSANERQVSFYVTEAELKKNCSSRWENGKCFMQLTLKGNVNQKFSIGYTYNDHPFQLVKDQIVHGPAVAKGNYSLNYVYHVEPNQPVAIYFNSKGRDLNIYTKMVKSEDFDDKMAIMFPNASNHDSVNINKVGHVTNVFYDANYVKTFGKSPEILISIRTSNLEDGPIPFDSNHAFILQSSLEGREILRTQTHTEMFQEHEWYYFTFYNNGNSNSLRVYVSSQVATKLEVGISRNKQSRPPFTNKPLVSETGIGSVELELTPKDLKTSHSNEGKSLKGYFTVAIKSSSSCFVNVFWNNKDDLNYIELTAGEPSSMSLDQNRKLYFSSFVKDTESKTAKDRGNIIFYIKASVRTDIYLLKSHSGDLDAPSSYNYTWKTSIAKAGGITMLKVHPDDPDYCIDCTYIGFADTMENGQITFLVDVEHDNMPIYLLPGLNFPFYLEKRQSKLYRMYNPDNGIISITLSMLSGFVNVYVSDSPNLSVTDYKDFYPLEKGLDNHKFITINPTKYNINAGHDYYVLISNPKGDPSSFILAVSKNTDHTPIEIGVSKYVSLAPGESTDLYYRPKKEENSFEVKLELRQVIDEKYTSQALELLSKYLNLYLMTTNGDKHIIKYKSKSIHENIIRIEFDLTENTQSTFSLHVYNPVGSAVTLTLELTHAGYKLVNLNEFSIDQVKGTNSIIYESYGIPNEYLFVDLRLCIGDVKVSFYQKDYDNIGKDEKTEYKTIKDANSFIHYIKMEAKKIYLKVENIGTDNSIYELNLFNEIDLDNNPYSEVVQGEGGKVDVETDNSKVKLHPVVLRAKYMEGFKHRINYKVYLTDSFKVMRYVKNCGKHLLDKTFDEPHVLSFNKVVTFNSEKELTNSKDKIDIKYSGLNSNTKYYGVVIASVELLPLDGGYLTPVRSAKVYYDEFIIMTPRLAFSVNMVVGILVSLGFLACLFWIVKSYIFGQINKMQGLEKLTNFEDLDQGVLGPNLISILEQEYYESSSVSTQPNKEKEVSDLDIPPHDEEDETQDNIELTDRSDATRPLA